MAERQINDDEAQAKKPSKAKTNRLIELDDIRNAVSTESTRRFMWRLLGRCGISRSSFNPNAMLMAEQEGERNIGLWLISEIAEADQGLYLQMQKEAMNLTKETTNG